MLSTTPASNRPVSILSRAFLIFALLHFGCLRAGEAQDAEAHYRMGLSFDATSGAGQDPTVAAKWYRLAAESGHAQAQYMLGLAYQSGRGVPVDRDQALIWLQRAAAQGHAKAQAFVKVAGESGAMQSSLASFEVAQAVAPRTKGTVLLDQDVLNGSFEVRGAGAADAFAFWLEEPSAADSVARDAAVSRSGRASCRFKVDGQGTYVSVRTPSELRFEAGRRYRITLWAKSDAGGGIQVSSTVGGAFFSSGPLEIEFRRFEREFVSDGGLLTIGRQFRISNGATLWVDDVVIELLD